MGLCKCPKRRVTNLFCFEHRVNVCEHCMVTNHPKCIVQSYILWLHDHDYNPICTLCSVNLSEGDCVRLTCYHMYHWTCLDKYARELPATTAPAGYTCPTCKERIFPDSKLVSPVADVLREKLAGVNWARAGLGLPLLSEDREQKPEQEHPSLRIETTSYQNHTTSSPSTTTSRSGSNVNSVHTNINNVHLNNQKVGPPYSIVNIDSSMGLSQPTSRKVCEAYDDPKEISFDHDENKYRRKSAIEWFLRWWKLIVSPPTRRRNSPGPLYKRYAVLGIMGILAFIGILILFSWLGRMATDGDPSYDLHADPNILVADKSAGATYLYCCFKSRDKIFSNHAIIVTGCDSGLGYSLALHCRQLGAIVIASVLQIDGPGAKQLENENVLVYPLDVTNIKSIENFANSVRTILTQNNLVLRCLINNAAVMIFGEFEWQTDEQLRNQVEVNLLGTMRITQELMPMIRAHFSRIIVISSHCNIQPIPGVAAYSGTKAALNAWATAIRMELKKHGIKVVCLIPGSFVNESNILARQVEHFETMRRSMSEEAKTFYGDYFNRYSQYFTSVGQNTSLKKLQDSGIYETFEGALLDKYPSPIYKNESWRYFIYHSLFMISPICLRDRLVQKFVQGPLWTKKNAND